MFYDYKGNSYTTLASAVSGALSEISTDSTNYTEFVNVKRAVQTAKGLRVPSTYLTNEEIANAVDSDGVTYVWHNKLTGTNVNYSTVATLQQANTSGFNDYKRSKRAEYVTDADGNAYYFGNTGNDSDALVNAKASIVNVGAEKVKDTNDDYIQVMGEVVIGDKTTSDSEFVRFKNYRSGWKNISSNSAFPDLSIADLPTLRVYEAGLIMTADSDFDGDNPINPSNAAVTSNVSDLEVPVGEYQHKIFTGYFLADSDATYTFDITASDDFQAIWVGDAAYGSGQTVDNVVSIKSTAIAGGHDSDLGEVVMDAGKYYPIKVMFGNKTGVASGAFQITTDTGRTITTLSPFWYRDKQ